jgi:hypothetical protein
MNARGERIGLKSRLAIEGDDAPGRQLAIASHHDEFLGDETDGTIGNRDDSEEPQPNPVECQKHCDRRSEGEQLHHATIEKGH